MRYLRKRESSRPDRAFVRINGRHVNLGRYGSTESKLKFCRVVDGGVVVTTTPAPPKGDTVGHIMLAYLEHAKSFYGDGHSEHWHAKAIGRVLIAASLSNTKSNDFGPKAFKAAIREMIDRDWSRRYINDQIGRIKKIWRWAVTEELTDASIVAALECVRGLQEGRTDAREADPREAVPIDVVEATLPHLSQTAADIVRLMLLTGARPSELCRLSPELLHRDALPEVLTVELPRHKTSKKGKRRFLVFGPQSQLILRRLRFPLPYTPTSLRRHITRACERNDLPHWTPYALRHTAGTTIREQFDWEHATAVLGHSKPDTTAIYAQRDLVKAEAVARRIG